MALNKVENETTAEATGSTLTGGTITLEAEADAVVDVLALGIVGSVSTGSGFTFSFAGVGSGSVNSIGSTVKASLNGGTTTATTSLSISSRDAATIVADSGAVTFVYARGPPAISIAIGVSAAFNDIANQTFATIEGPASVSAADLDLTAESTSRIDALTLAGGGAVTNGSGFGFAFSASGAGSKNVIRNMVEARMAPTAITGSPAPVITTGASSTLTIKASDRAEILADAGGASVAIDFGQGAGAQVSVGAAIALNDVANSVTAIIDSTRIDAAGHVEVLAESRTLIDVFTFGFAGTLKGGQGLNFAFDLAGSGSINRIGGTTLASIASSVVDADGDVTVTSTDEATIEADAAALRWRSPSARAPPSRSRSRSRSRSTRSATRHGRRSRARRSPPTGSRSWRPRSPRSRR